MTEDEIKEKFDMLNGILEVIMRAIKELKKAGYTEEQIFEEIKRRIK
jgi:hypothetical protein